MVKADGSKQDVLTGLPSWGDHHNNRVVFGPDGYMYFGQGTATNSGVGVIQVIGLILDIKMERIYCGLTFPTSLEFDDRGDLYVAEAGYSYGPAYAEAKGIRICHGGEIEEVVSGFEGPLTGMAWQKTNVSRYTSS